MAFPDFYYNSFSFTTNTDSFTGTLEAGVAQCQFDGENGHKGEIILVFKEGNKIEVTINYSEICFKDKEELYSSQYETYKSTQEGREQYKKILPIDGEYLFRPYSLYDIKNTDPLKTTTLKLNLDSWGKTNFVTIIFSGNKLDLPPDDLIALMAFEYWFDPATKNPDSSATGLIHF